MYLNCNTDKKAIIENYDLTLTRVVFELDGKRNIILINLNLTLTRVVFE